MAEHHGTHIHHSSVLRTSEFVLIFTSSPTDPSQSFVAGELPYSHPAAGGQSSQPTVNPYIERDRAWWGRDIGRTTPPWSGGKVRPATCLEIPRGRSPPPSFRGPIGATLGHACDRTLSACGPGFTAWRSLRQFAPRPSTIRPITAQGCMPAVAISDDRCRRRLHWSSSSAPEGGSEVMSFPGCAGPDISAASHSGTARVSL